MATYIVYADTNHGALPSGFATFAPGGSSVAFGATGLATPTNLFTAFDGNVATLAISNNTMEGNLLGFSTLASVLGSGVTISSATIEVLWKYNTTASGPGLAVRAFAGHAGATPGTAIDAQSATTVEPTTNYNSFRTASAATLAQLRDAAFCVGVCFDRASLTAVTATVEYVRLVIVTTEQDPDRTPRGAWGMYRLIRGYNQNLIRLRRVSDSVESNFGMVAATGLLDTAAVAAFIGGSSGTVVTWYDQSGNGNHLTQATTADQPSYDAATAFGGRPSVKFGRTSATDGFPLRFSDGGASAGDFSGMGAMAMAIRPTNLTNLTHIFSKVNAAAGAAAGEIAWFMNLTTGKLELDRPNVIAGAVSTAGLVANTDAVVGYEIDGSLVTHYLAGAANGTDIITEVLPQDGAFTLGTGNFSTGTQQNPLDGYIRAFVIWDAHSSKSNRQVVENYMLNNTVAAPPADSTEDGAAFSPAWYPSTSGSQTPLAARGRRTH